MRYARARVEDTAEEKLVAAAVEVRSRLADFRNGEAAIVRYKEDVEKAKLGAEDAAHNPKLTEADLRVQVAWLNRAETLLADAQADLPRLEKALSDVTDSLKQAFLTAHMSALERVKMSVRTNVINASQWSENNASQIARGAVEEVVRRSAPVEELVNILPDQPPSGSLPIDIEAFSRYPGVHMNSRKSPIERAEDLIDRVRRLQAFQG
jgi:hypothetical protein